jgi:hypothetical protein
VGPDLAGTRRREGGRASRTAFAFIRSTFASACIVYAPHMLRSPLSGGEAAGVARMMVAKRLRSRAH